MKKKLLIFLIIIFILSPFFSQASECSVQTGLVRCGIDASCPCEILDFFAMLGRIYNFIVWDIATPLAVIAITVGGILMMISAGNPTLFGKGKEILKWAIIGLVLVFCSYLIINFILTTLGYTGT